jgi:hypothetical protein
MVDAVKLTVNGVAVAVPAGESVYRRSASGEPRGPGRKQEAHG